MQYTGNYPSVACPLGLSPSRFKTLLFFLMGLSKTCFYADIKSELNNAREMWSILKKAERMTPQLGAVVLLHFWCVWIFFLFFDWCPTWHPPCFQVNVSHTKWRQPSFRLFLPSGFSLFASFTLSHVFNVANSHGVYACLWGYQPPFWDSVNMYKH